ncbi:AHH domain-containing protein [Simiduia curdlanivorans]|uniref:AHH domain-containing protein n=1 Tax=Simiduia curdlanivorans TaxID=1492769 RepID=A0ABV8V8V8_9GAMM|nr:AHH domain-containing protein [Simiduia curdlanivorans]MDN3639321.1 AHH domain-containing protein [Simiduia curdlanivorans]
MPVPANPKRFHEMDRVEQKIHSVSQKTQLTQNDLTAVAALAQIETVLDKYRYSADEMTRKERRDEEHQSKRLSEFLESSGDHKPHPLCHAHAIVSGAHKGAATARAILAFFKLRIDDPYNGCWLPENTAALSKMPRPLKHAVPHSRIHRYNYYFWLASLINMNKIKATDDLKYTLKTIGLQLQAGAQPDYVMLKKGQGIPS